MNFGVLRREESRDPNRILVGLNEAMLAQASMQSIVGFTTARCVRLDKSGGTRLPTPDISLLMRTAGRSRLLHRYLWASRPARIMPWFKASCTSENVWC
jgi:hypothetical protein